MLCKVEMTVRQFPLRASVGEIALSFRRPRVLPTRDSKVFKVQNATTLLKCCT